MLTIVTLKSVPDYFIIWISVYHLLLFSVFSKLLPEVDYELHFRFLSAEKLPKLMLSSLVSHSQLLNNHVISKWWGSHFSIPFNLSFYPIIIFCLLTLKSSKRFFFVFCLYLLVIFSVRTDVKFRVHHYIVLLYVCYFFSPFLLFVLIKGFLFLKFLTPTFTLCWFIVLHILYFFLVMTLGILLHTFSLTTSRTKQYFNPLSKAWGIKQF